MYYNQSIIVSSYIYIYIFRWTDPVYILVVDLLIKKLTRSIYF